MTVLGSSSAVLSARSLGKRYGSRWALRDVSFASGPGEMVAVIGPNGAGKTTLLSILGGVQRPSEGEVAVGAPGSAAGGPRADTGPSAEAGHRAGTDPLSGTGVRIGWVPQQPALYSKLSVAENLRLFARLERVGDVEAAVARMLEQTGLQDRAGERLQRLSGGNRQRVNVALGLLSDPPAILLDEPSSALDPGQRERLWQLVCDLAGRGTCVLFSTHIVAEAARYAARVLVLDEGRLVFDGPPGRLAELGGGGDFEHAFVSFLRSREEE